MWLCLRELFNFVGDMDLDTHPGNIFQFDHINSIIGNIYVPGTVALSTAYAKHTTVGNPLSIK